MRACAEGAATDHTGTRRRPSTRSGRYRGWPAARPAAQLATSMTTDGDEAPQLSARGPAAAAGAAALAVAPRRSPAARSGDHKAAPARGWPPPRSGQHLGRPAGRRAVQRTSPARPRPAPKCGRYQLETLSSFPIKLRMATSHVNRLVTKMHLRDRRSVFSKMGSTNSRSE